MSASETIPRDAFDLCKCGHDIVDHDVTAQGDLIHPDGYTICKDNWQEARDG